MFDFNWSGLGQTSFLNDLVNITIFYDTDNLYPNASLISPANRTITNISSINFTCAATDNFNLTNIAIFTNISGTFDLNQTAGVSETANTSIFEISAIPDGTYEWNCQARDIADFTNFSAANYTFTVDTILPKVINLTPFVNQKFNQTQTINITANITDIGGLDKAFANTTLPNTNTQQTEMTRNGDIFSAVLTNTLIIGQYNITYIANDTAKNMNRTVTTFFNISDVTPPAVTILQPTNDEAGHFISENVTIKINATDPYINNTDKVLANITLPNATVIPITLTNTLDGFYNTTFNQTTTLGTYTLRVFANDTSNNINSSVTRTFVILNNSLPTVKFVYPPNNFYNNTGNITFSCNASTTNTLSNITLFTNISGTFQPTNLTRVTGQYSQINVTILNINESKVSWNCQANDSAYLSAFETINHTVIIDKTFPAVTNAQPTEALSITAGNSTSINATATDNEAVDQIYASITTANNVNTNISLPLLSGTQYRSNFTNTTRAGRYNITFYANDSATNINGSVTTYFIVIDNILPNITITGCTPAIPEPFQSVTCNATITDAAGISNVNANVTQPTTETVYAQTILNSGSNYYFTFTTTTKNGTYPVQWHATDINGNNQTANDSFRVIDTLPPNINLIAPPDAVITNSTRISFSFNTTDIYDTTFSCSLWINNTLNQTNTNVQNNTLTNLTTTNIPNGNNNWNISCTDTANNYNSSPQRTFTVDTGPPEFNSLTYVPTQAFQLKPNVQLNFTANISDNITSVSTATLQYKISTNTTYTDITMGSLGNSLYNASFTPTQEGVYNVRLTSTDAAGNTGYSALINITIAFSRTWDITPTTISKTANLSQNITLGNFTINNTGDFPLNFTITSNYASTTFDKTFPLEIAAGTKTEVQVNVTTPSTTGITQINFLTNATPNANPDSINTTGIIAVFPGQPILQATLSAPTKITRGTTAELTAQLQNIGEGNASNVTFFYTLPAGWTVSIGTQNLSVGDLLSGETANNNIKVSIATNAQLGNQTVTANSTGQNQSGTDISTLGLIIGATRIVEVNDPPQPIGPGGGGGSAGAGGGGASASAGGGPAGTTAPGLVRTLTTQEFIETKETINIVRGETKEFPLKVTNVFENTKLFNIKMTMSGYLAQYLTSTPEALNDIAYTQSKSFFIAVASPAYREKGTYELTVTITGDATAKDFVTQNGKVSKVNSIKHFTEKRTITLNIHEVSPELAQKETITAEEYVKELAKEGLPSKRAKNLQEQIQTAYANNDYGLVERLAGELKTIRDQAIESKELINKITEKINTANKKGIDISETKKLLVLAKSALAREDYEIALQRLREAEVLEIIETKGAFNLLAFLKQYWWALLLISGILTTAGLLTYRKILLSIIAQKITDLSSEEITIFGLMRDLQVACFKDKKIQITEYHKKMYHYEQRLERIKILISKLRTKRIALSTLDEEIRQLTKEKTRITELMKETQELYFLKHTLSAVKYKKRMEEYRIRLAEVEESTALLESKFAKREEQKKKIKTALKKAVKPETIKYAIEKAKQIKEQKEKQYYLQDQDIIAILEPAKQKTQTKEPPEPSIRETEKAFTEKLQTASYPTTDPDVLFAKCKEEILSSLKTTYQKGLSELFAQKQQSNEQETQQEKIYKITPKKIDFATRKKTILEELKEAFKNA